MSQIDKNQPSHPLSKGRLAFFKTKSCFRLWRCLNGKFYCCNQDQYLDLLEKLMNFDEEQYKNTIKENNNGFFPNGYYYANHETQRGGFLYTDDYDEMIEALKAKNLL